MVLVNPHQYTLQNLLIRTPGVHVDLSGISSFITHVHDGVVSKIIFFKSVWCLRGQYSTKNNIFVAQKHSFFDTRSLKYIVRNHF